MVSAGALGLLFLAGPCTSLKLGTLDSAQDDTSLKAKKTNLPPPKAEELPATNLCPRVTSLHGPFMHNFNLATGSKTPKISQSLSKLEVSQCPSSMQK